MSSIDATTTPTAADTRTTGTTRATTAKSPRLRRIVLLLDTVVLGGAWLLTVALTTAAAAGGGAPASLLGAPEAQTGGFVAAGLLVLRTLGLYQRRVCVVRSLELARSLTAAGLLGLFASALLLPAGGRAALTFGAVLTLLIGVLLTSTRGMAREWIRGRRAAGDYCAPVVAVGQADDASGLIDFLNEHPVLGFDVRGVVGVDRAVAEDVGLPHLGEVADVAAAAHRVGATGAVVVANGFHPDELNEVVIDLTEQQLHVHVSSGLRGIEARRIQVAPLADETFLNITPVTFSQAQQVGKRVVDLVVGSVAVVLTAPVMAVVALAVWATDRGPVLFAQERVGRDGVPFTLLKFRTMAVDAEARLDDLVDDNVRGGPLFKMAGDPRVTRVGRLLRATSLDELPQLWNVLRGSMSMVGPRPALADEAAQFDRRLQTRDRVKPGMTGLWQVEARDLPSFDLYRRYDLLYVQNWSVALDLAIILRTVTSVSLRGFRAVRAALPGQRDEARTAAVLD